MNGIGARIKEVRETKNYTQKQFAEKLGLQRNTVGGYEIEKVNPSDRTIQDICDKFNVNEKWLRTGDGDMFVKESREAEISGFISNILKKEEDNFQRRLIRVLSQLDESEWKLIEKMVEKMVDEMNKSGQ